jgi:KipI family sensor histidine kinase inhibitor
MTPRLRDAGDSALSVEFGDRIDDALSAQVLALDAALAADPLPGVVETVPTYRALLIRYDPMVLPRARLVAHVAAVQPGAAAPAQAGALWTLPACTAPDMAEDLAHVAATTGLSPDRVLDLFLSTTYRLAMYGFAPGWAYLSGLPPALKLPRRTTPRDRIAAGSLIIAGGQAIVAGPAMPSGWHILGRTPEAMFAPARTPPFLMQPGDRLRFEPVDPATFAALQTRVAGGEVIARRSA